MPFKKGMQKVPGSGRRRGTKNVATLEKALLQAEGRIQQMEERNIASQSDEMPLDFLLRRMRISAFSPTERFLAARAAAPYCHAQLTAIAHKHMDASGNIIGPTVTVSIIRAPPEAPLTVEGQKADNDTLQSRQIGKWKA
jgi:hypothetical protein